MKMKRKLQILFFLIIMTVCVGCGGTANEKKSTTEETKATKETVETDPGLNVAKDEFTFDKLVGRIGKKEANTYKMFGADEKADQYKTKLFGEDVIASLTTKDKKVNTITLLFEKTDSGSLENAISEQLGVDGKEKEKKIQWKYDGNTVILSKESKGCKVTIK